MDKTEDPRVKANEPDNIAALQSLVGCMVMAERELIICDADASPKRAERASSLDQT